MQPTLDSLARDLAAGRTTSLALTEACLAAIAAPQGEGGSAFIFVDREGALAQARAADALRREGRAPSRYAGIPVSTKDLFDIAGQRTVAASKILADAPPAKADADAVARLRQAGLVLIGRTNMPEFAYSGLGLNPHFGTPRNPWRREEAHVPGGSTAGGAVSVADGMAHAALGSDTGGSCRIPAAFTGIVGWKPSTYRVPRGGMYPLSKTLDSAGPLGRSVACCAALDAILSGEESAALDGVEVKGLNLAVPQTLVLDGMDDDVARAFERALSKLSQAGAKISEIAVPEFASLGILAVKGGIAAAEAFAWHKDTIAAHAALYDPRVLKRLEGGRDQEASHDDLLAARRAFIAAVSARIAAFDALLYPTVPVVPPKIADVENDPAFTAANLLALRNPALINLLDGCAMSLPMHRAGDAPAGLMLAAARGHDHAVLRHGAAVEKILRDT